MPIPLDLSRAFVEPRVEVAYNEVVAVRNDALVERLRATMDALKGEPPDAGRALFPVGRAALSDGTL